MRITFDSAARNDLERISAWIAGDNPRAAFEMIARIEERVYRLTTPGLSHMGHVGAVTRTLELIEYPYIIVYKVLEKRHEIQVISIVHGSQNR